MLESYCHPATWFVTLTYDQEHVPADGSVDPRHLVLFLKRLRKRLGVGSLRYFGVGEYGGRTFRPHYHLTIFGPDRADLADEWLGKKLVRKGLVSECWGMGFTVVKPAEVDMIAYVANYTLKKMTKATDPRLGGRHPEFVRMSRRPGIGGLATDKLGLLYKSEMGRREFFDKGGVGYSFRHEGRLFPFDRYLRTRMSSSVDLGREAFNEWEWEWLKRRAADLRMMTKEERDEAKVRDAARAAREFKRLDRGVL